MESCTRTVLLYFLVMYMDLQLMVPSRQPRMEKT